MDGLRAIAMASVLLFHAGISPFSGGFSGVDVFFVISGLLISRTIFHEGGAWPFLGHRLL
jgi:peptidoglycan/LPS O-acetylase OafA/YrhL